MRQPSGLSSICMRSRKNHSLVCAVVQSSEGEESHFSAEIACQMWCKIKNLKTSSSPSRSPHLACSFCNLQIYQLFESEYTSDSLGCSIPPLEQFFILFLVFYFEIFTVKNAKCMKFSISLHFFMFLVNFTTKIGFLCGKRNQSLGVENLMSNVCDFWLFVNTEKVLFCQFHTFQSTWWNVLITRSRVYSLLVCRINRVQCDSIWHFWFFHGQFGF